MADKFLNFPHRSPNLINFLVSSSNLALIQTNQALQSIPGLEMSHLHKQICLHADHDGLGGALGLAEDALAQIDHELLGGELGVDELEGRLTI